MDRTEAAGRSAVADPDERLPVWERLADALAPVNYVPALAPGEIEVRRFDSRDGPYYMLKQVERRAYARLTPDDYAIFRQIDGQRSVQELALLYFQEHRRLAFGRVAGLVGQLRALGFLADRPVDVYTWLGERYRRRRRDAWLRALARGLLYREFPIHGIDGFVTAGYRAGGWMLFRPPVLGLMTLVALVGLALFVGQLASGRFQLLRSGELALLAALLLLPLDLLVAFIHEMAHALTAKHYGREVPRGGFLIYFAAPAYFVDTTDTWMAPQRARVGSAFAGTFSGFVLGGFCSFGQFLVEPGSLASGLLYQLAFLGYLESAFNLVPLLELDGYYILVDLLGIPRLRAKSFAFLRHELVGKLARRERFSREERIFAAYGLGAVAFGGLMLFWAFWFWHYQFAGLVGHLLEQPGPLPKLGLAALVVVLGGPLLLGLWELLAGGLHALAVGLRRARGRAHDWRLRQRLALLGGLPFLQHTGPGGLRRIAELLRDERFRAGSLVIRQGDPGERFYLIRSGRAEVLKRQPDGQQRRVALLGPGDYFGELALLHRQPRNATIRALDDLALHWLDREDFAGLLAPELGLFDAVRARLQWRDRIRAIPVFSALGPAELDLVLAKLEQHHFAPGTTLMRQGEPGDRFYVIAAGEVEVLVAPPDAAEDDSAARVATLGAGQYVGEIALLLDVPRTATVRALGPVEALSLGRRDFRDLLGRYLDLGGSFEAISRQRLAALRSHLAPQPAA